MTIEEKLAELGIELPECPTPVGAYVPAVRTGNLVFTAGQIPLFNGSLLAEGKVPADVSPEACRLATRQALLNALAAIRQEVGSLEAVRKVVRLNVYVASAPGFVDQAQIANGASDLLGAIFGTNGHHTRCAVGVAELPLGAPVELDLIVEVAD